MHLAIENNTHCNLKTLGLRKLVLSCMEEMGVDPDRRYVVRLFYNGIPHGRNVGSMGVVQLATTDLTRETICMALQGTLGGKP